MTEAADAIRARRKLTNKFIAAHQAARLKPFFAPDMNLIAGDGSLLIGAAAILQAFEAQFRDPGFIAYERTPDEVTLGDSGGRAAERGRWIASWKDGTRLSGPYLAAWRKVTGQWVIESETFVTLEGDG
jgi:ketosteroid isomerase-like protein